MLIGQPSSMSSEYNNIVISTVLVQWIDGVRERRVRVVSMATADGTIPPATPAVLASRVRRHLLVSTASRLLALPGRR